MNAHRVLFVALLSSMCIPALAAKSIDITRAVNPKGEIRISTLAGQVKVRGWHKAKVHVSGKLAEQADRLDVKTDATGIEIKVVYPHSSHGNFNDNEGSRLTIDVPRINPVNVNTVSADIDVRGVRGRQRIKSTSGNVTLTSKSKDIGMQSVSGDTNLNGSAAGAHIEAGSISGDVSLSGVNGELAANSVSGDVNVKKSRITRSSIKSTSGDVDFQGSIAKGGEYDFHTVSGELTLNFPAPPDARFDINTFSGEIENNFGPKPKKSSPYTSARKLSFVNGKGDAMVNIDALSGTIKLHAGG